MSGFDDYVDPVTAPPDTAPPDSAPQVGFDQPGAPRPDGTRTEITVRPVNQRPPLDPTHGDAYNTVDDVGRSFGGGLGRGVAGLVGLPGMVGDVTRWGLTKAGVPEDIINKGAAIARHVPVLQGFTGADPGEVQRAIEAKTGEFYRPKTIYGDYASTAGEFVPGSILGPESIGLKVANTLIPAFTSETAGQLTKDTPYEPYARFAGGLFGSAVPKTYAPIKAPSADYKAATDILEKAGIPLSAGALTNSPTVRTFESAAKDMPIASHTAQQLEENTASAYDRAITAQMFDRSELSRRGVPPDMNLPSAKVAAAGAQSLEDKYTDLSSRNWFKSDPQLHQDMVNARNEYNSKSLPSQRAGGRNDLQTIHDEVVDKLVNGWGRMSGDDYQALRSRMRVLSEGQRGRGGDPFLATALDKTKKALDDAMARNISPADAAAWKLNNLRYANMKQTEGAVAKDTLNLSPQAVAQSVKSGRQGLYGQQRGNMDELVNAAATVLKPVPNSYTGARTAVHNMLNIPTMAMTGLGAGGGFLGAGVPGAIAGAAIGGFVPGSIARLGVSKIGQQFLSNRLPGQATVAGASGRDILAQALTQQAISQPGGVNRNQANRAAANQQALDERRRLGLE